MRKVWVVMDDAIALDAVFTTKTATMRHIKQKWPGGKFDIKVDTFLNYKFKSGHFVCAYYRIVNKPVVFAKS